jgi:hypothetical protein
MKIPQLKAGGYGSYDGYAAKETPPITSCQLWQFALGR